MIKLMGSYRYVFRILFMLPLIFSISGCSDTEKEFIDASKIAVENKISNLQLKLKRNEIRNAVLLKTYASKLRSMKPDLVELAKVFELDAFPNGPAIKGFKERLQVVKSNPKSIGDNRAIIEELESLDVAVDPEVYNNSLIDVINTLAELSGGALPKISEPKVKEKKGEESATSGAGRRLVGNPTYGYWQSSGGQSFWVWYGQYSMFRSLWGRPYYYHSWYYDRPWSYYNDYGRSMYSSRSQRTQYSNLKTSNQRKIKEYGAKKGRSYSSYSGTKSNSSFKPSATGRNSSGYRSASSSRSSSSYSSRSSSSYSASHRTGSRSRSSYGGK